MIIEASETNDDARKKSLLKELGRLNVNCIACHNIKATAIAPGLLGKPEQDAIYTTGSAETSEHRTIRVNTLDKALFCAQCHGRYMAPDGEQIVCNTLNGSYYDGYIARGGSETCQDCHMKRAGRGHYFPGGHDREIVKEGIGFEAEISGVRHTVGEAVPTAVIQASLINRAGHRIPDG
jgi:mono/diheme cytochrome c family protein